MANLECLTNILDLSLKASYYHNVGFYCNFFITYMHILQVVIGGQTLDLGPNRIVNFSYDSKDLIVQEQRVFNSTEEFPLGTKIFHADGNYIGVVTNKYEDGSGLKYYPIPGGKSVNYYHFSDISEFIVKHKEKPIAYADKTFATKDELVTYLASPAEPSPRKAILYLTEYKLDKPTACQLIVSENGRNIVSIHFRSPAINHYRLPATSHILNNIRFN